MKRRIANRDGVYQRKGVYWISWTDANGIRRRERTHSATAEHARSLRQAKLIRVERSIVLGFTPPTQDYFQAIAERFLTYQAGRLTPAGLKREQGIVRKHLISTFPLRIAELRRVDIQNYLLKRNGKAKPDSIIKEFNTLKHLLRLAVEWECIPTNPAQGVRPPRAAAGRVRYLQPKEFQTILSYAPEWLRPIIIVAVHTGMRRSEILKLCPLDIDFSHNRVFLRQTKNGESRAVYLNTSATAVLSSVLPQIFSAYTPAQVSMAFSRAAKEAGILDFRFHDLRHTAASWLRMSGADIHTVAQILGHKDLRMAARYQHLSPSFMAEAVAKLDVVFGAERHHSVTPQKTLEAGTAASA